MSRSGAPEIRKIGDLAYLLENPGESPSPSDRAVTATCPHEMASLGAGKVEKMWTAQGVGKLRASEERCVIVCPWHNFEFDLDTGLSPCEPGRLRIKTYRAESEGSEIVVYA